MKPGDVVLTQSHGARGILNRVAQALVSGKRTKFTHVLLCVAPGVLMDATPEHGVQLRNVVREVLGGRLTDQMVADGTLVALRPAEGKWDPSDGTGICSTMAHLGKKYNWGFLIPHSSDADGESERATSAFCSELVSVMLKGWGVLPGDTRPASKTLPVHFDRLQKTEEWQDVTHEWAERLRGFRVKGESEKMEDCKDLGLALCQANQQIHLQITLQAVEVNQKEAQKNLEALWVRHAGLLSAASRRKDGKKS